MNSVFIFGGLIALWIGWTLIFRKDKAWEWTQNSNRRKGVSSERNYDWEMASTLQGYFLMAFGIGFIGFGLYQWYQEAMGGR